MQIADLVRTFSSMQTTENKAPKGSRDANAARGTAQTSGNAQVSSLSKGQTFEGSVSSIKGDKVTLTLANGETVNARLSGDVNISEGESVFFQVKSNDGSMVNIRPVSIGMMQNPAILSALDMAGMAKSERNITTVNAMMQEQMPIDSKSLADMTRTVMANPGADIETLVTMKKAGLPINKEMIEQFENYRESEGAILDAVDDLIDSMEDAFSNPKVKSEDIGAFLKNIMSIIETPEGVSPLLQDSDGNPLENTIGAGMPLEEADLQEAGLIEKEEADVAFVSAEGEEAIPKEEAVTISEGTGGSLSGSADKVVAEQPGQSTENTAKANTAENDAATQKDSTNDISRDNAFISGVLEDDEYVDLDGNKIAASADDRGAYEKGSVGEQLSDKLIQNLSDELKDIGFSDSEFTDAKGNIRPDADAAGLFGAVSDHISSDRSIPKEALLKLFSSDPFKEITGRVMADKWTIPPEKAADKEAIKELYAKVSVDMQRIAQAADEAVKGRNPISQAAESIKNNVDFINQVNQLYSYVQLPLKLSGQNATGELYVYSNKKKTFDENDELSAFLHFDLEHLGSTDISVKMKNKNVSTDFYMSDDISFELVKENLPVLQSKLTKLGYSCTLNISNEEKEVDFVEDFLFKDQAPVSGVRRYTFDVTA